MNVLAIIAFVLTLCSGPVLGLILGIIALVQTKRTGERGRGFAIAAVTISSVLLAAIVGVIGVALATGYDFGEADRDPDSGQVTDPGNVNVFDLQVGDCITSPPEEDDTIRNLRAVPCEQPHLAEVYALFDLPSGSYPSEDEIFAAADDGCFERLETYSPAAMEDESVSVSYLYPTEDSWTQGDHEITCLAITETEQTGSIRDL